MKTTKPISTISFNSPQFLALKMDELYRSKIVSFWAFITHEPEPDNDEAGGKVHSHLYIEPSKLVQTDDLKDVLKEYDPSHPDKPLGCIVFRNSVFSDWYFYGLHDPVYLASKGLSRKFHYRHEDVMTSDTDTLLYLVRTSELSNVTVYDRMKDAISVGMTFDEFLYRGSVPPQQVRNYKTAWDSISSVFKLGKYYFPYGESEVSEDERQKD